MFVEKVDLRKLFEPICKKYHIPIANSKGWSDLFQRAEMMNRFSAAEERGQECVLLYCGDFDPWGLKIGDTLKKNIAELTQATGYDPEDLKIDRFGLNYEFIIANDLTWIDNLTSSSGKDMSKSNYCYNCNRQYDEDVLRCSGCRKKLYIQPDFVRDYVKTYGARKCEANALVVVPQQGRDLAEEMILKYLGLDSVSRFEVKSKTIKAEFEKYMTKYPILFKQLSKQADILKREEQVEAKAEEDDNSGA
jgi:hypothetical protein